MSHTIRDGKLCVYLILIQITNSLSDFLFIPCMKTDGISQFDGLFISLLLSLFVVPILKIHLVLYIRLQASVTMSLKEPVLFMIISLNESKKDRKGKLNRENCWLDARFVGLRWNRQQQKNDSSTAADKAVLHMGYT